MVINVDVKGFCIWWYKIIFSHIGAFANLIIEKKSFFFKGIVFLLIMEKYKEPVNQPDVHPHT